jgi:hypothetical protein
VDENVDYIRTPRHPHPALAAIDQSEGEAASIAANRATLRAERQRALAYRDFYRMAATRAENLLDFVS